MFNFLSKFIKHGSLIITHVSSANSTVEEFLLDNVYGITDGKSLT
jgi:hypothetical protein